MNRYRIAAAILAGTSVLAAPAMADPVTERSANLNIGLTVYEECTIATSPMAFDAIGLIAEEQYAEGAITIECTSQSPYEIGLDLGDNASGSTRRMTNGTEFTEYELYTSDDYDDVWGNAKGSTAMASDVGGAPNIPKTYTVYGRIPVQNVQAGNYTDTVTATIWYAGALTP